MKLEERERSTCSAVKLHGGYSAPEGHGECGSLYVNGGATTTLLTHYIAKDSHLGKHNK